MNGKRTSLLIATAIVALAAGTSWADETSLSQIPTTGEKPEGAPYTVKRDWGTFTLNPRIAEKVKKHEPINYVFSYRTTGVAVYSPQFAAGYQHGCELGNAIYPLNCASLAPVTEDINVQMSQVDTKLAAGAIDCFSIQPPTGDASNAIINKMMSMGIPAFTVGLPTGGHEFTNYTQVPIKEGEQAAEIVIKWMQDSGLKLRTFAVSSVFPSQNWAQGRMKGFHDTIMKALPDAKFVTTEDNAIDTSSDPGKIFDTFKTFLLGHPEVEFILNTDIGAGKADRAIGELKRNGKVFTIGWNVLADELDGIEAGVQVALLDQRWPDQAAFGGAACAQFLANGVILPNSQVLRPIFKADVPAARKELASILKTGN